MGIRPLSMLSKLIQMGLLTVLSWSADAELIPAHVFPDATSDVITHLEISKETLAQYPRVLDASLTSHWFWTTHEGEFIGYVSKRDITGKNRLRPKTLIRMDPTYSSWILTQYEPGDDIRVRSRLSVGRVSIKKRIPVYFRLPKQVKTPAQTEQRTPTPFAPAEDAVIESLEETLSLPDPVSEITTPPATQPDQIELEESKPEQQPDLWESASMSEPEVETTSDDKPADLSETPEPIQYEQPTAKQTVKVIPEEAELGAQEEPIDPLLEEKPRIDRQDLADMAPPSTNLFQEFEGFLRVVPGDDPNVEFFNYQLETRSGRRIVYVATRTLTASTYEDHVDRWINVRGTLEETEPEFILFIEAHNIWIGTGK
jgi:hypothetical protein